jgi:hypothetical protein
MIEDDPASVLCADLVVAFPLLLGLWNLVMLQRAVQDEALDEASRAAMVMPFRSNRRRMQ